MAVGREVVCPQGVDADQQDVRLGPARLGRPAGRAEAERRKREGKLGQAGDVAWGSDRGTWHGVAGTRTRLKVTGGVRECQEVIASASGRLITTMKGTIARTIRLATAVAVVACLAFAALGCGKTEAAPIEVTYYYLPG